MDLIEYILKFAQNEDLQRLMFVDRNCFHLVQSEIKYRLTDQESVNRFGLVAKVYLRHQHLFQHNPIVKIFKTLRKVFHYFRDNFMCSETWIFGCITYQLNREHYTKIEKKWKSRCHHFKKLDDLSDNAHQSHSCMFLLMQKDCASSWISKYLMMSSNCLVFLHENVKTLKQCLKYDIPTLRQLVEETRSIYYVKYIKNPRLFQTLLEQDDNLYNLNKRDRLIYCRHPDNFERVKSLLASYASEDKLFDQLLKLPLPQLKLVLSYPHINLQLIKLCRLYHSTPNIKRLILQLNNYF